MLLDSKELRLTVLVLIFSFVNALGQNCTELSERLKSGQLLEIEKLISGNEDLCPDVIGEIYLRKGRNDLAEEYFTKALEGAQSKEKRASALNNLGIVFWNGGHAEKAKEYILEALEIRKSVFGENHELTAASYNDLGLVISNIDIDKSLTYYESAHKIYQQVLGDKNEKTAQALINIGISYRSLEFFGDATNNFNDALKLWKELYPNGHPNEAFIINNIGQTKQMMNDLDGAKKEYEKALLIYMKFYGDKHPEVANTMNLIGSVYNIKGEFDMALSYYQKAMIANTTSFSSEDLELNPKSDDYLNANILVSSLYYKSEAFANLHYNKTLKFNDLKKSLDALSVCDTLIDVIRQLRTNEADKLALGQIASTVYETGVTLCKGMGDVAVRKDEYYEKAFFFAEKSKSAVLLEAISDAQAKSFAGISTEDLSREKDLKSELAFYENALIAEQNEDLKITYRSTLLALRQEYSEFVKTLETKYPEYYELKFNQTQPSVSQIQGKLKPDETLLSYFLTSNTNRIFTFEITDSKFKIHSEPKSEDFSRYLAGFRNGIYFRDKAVYLSTGNLLYEQLIPKRLDKNTKHLIIIPYGQLSTIPFEALLTDDPKDEGNYSSYPFLVRNYDISYYYSSTLFLIQKAANVEENSAFLCAPIVFKDLADLPGTAREVEGLSTALTKKGITSKAILLDDANESLIKNSDFKQYKYLHFATHGVVDEDNPSQSRIFLNPKDLEDGSLFSGEIYNLNLKSDLVTLSACETGLGKLTQGEGVIGLSRALLYAGANNIIVSLWKVSDQSTSDLMIDFYSQNQDTDYALPLRTAKLNLLAKEKYAEPYYWAPFILIGR
ncbi:CHAT domain-containing protein [Fulvivirga sp.]|uniref:CHAT domain-containing protein n=1 Tax=Fulvivirga sp. TaxID=1931237 RepID=UPI0032EE2655